MREIEQGIYDSLTASTEQIKSEVIGLRNAIEGDMWVWCPPKSGKAVTLVAHMDTVWKVPAEREGLQTHNNIVISADPSRGTGADDRAGIYIVRRLAKELGCGLLLLDGEEVGGIGANEVSRTKTIDEISNRSLCLIELDRRGVCDVVTYDFYGESQDLVRLATNFGYSKASGTFSDVAILGPAAGLMRLNISCGYFNEHMVNEQLSLDAVQYALSNVSRLVAHLNKEQEVYAREVSKYTDRAGGWGHRYSRSYDYYGGYDDYGDFRPTRKNESSDRRETLISEYSVNYDQSFVEDNEHRIVEIPAYDLVIGDYIKFVDDWAIIIDLYDDIIDLEMTVEMADGSWDCDNVDYDAILEVIQGEHSYTPIDYREHVDRWADYDRREMAKPLDKAVPF